MVKFYLQIQNLSAMFKPTINQLKKVLSQKGFPFYDDGMPYHLNIVGIKNNRKSSGLFAGTIMVCYIDFFGTLLCDYFSALLKPVDILQLSSRNKKDIIQLQEGHYPDSFEKRIEKGGAKLVPIKNLRYVRGKFTPDFTSSKVPSVGIPNIRIEGHLGFFSPETIRVWSNGSQFVEKGYEILLYLLEKACQNHGNIFSYTLLNRSDFNEQ